MARTVGGIVAGVISWLVVITAIGFIIRAADPVLAATLNAHATTSALAERLAISFVASLISGVIAARIGGGNAALGAGVVLLLW